jgi:molybdopterin molybdotransferase
MALISVEAALAAVRDGVVPTETETVPLAEAAGRTLAADLAARLDLPPSTVSAMDGYAVRRADLDAGTRSLTVVGEAAAGRGFDGRLGASEAVRIFTGAALPDGTDAVVMQEDVTLDGATIALRPDAGHHAGHVRARGQDFLRGAVGLTAGSRLGPRALLLAAAMGHGAVPVRRRPRVAILATGDELVPPGEPLPLDRIVASNAFGIAALAHQAGAEPIDLGIAEDTREALAAKLAAAVGADVLVTIGGASVGDYDLVRAALAGHGAREIFAGLAMRPGKPVALSRIEPRKSGRTTHVLSLPGNPASALVTARIFLVALIRSLLASADDGLATRSARLTRPIEANSNRQNFLRASFAWGADGVAEVTPGPRQDSSLITVLAASDALIVRPPGAPAAAAGALVPFLPFDVA